MLCDDSALISNLTKRGSRPAWVRPFFFDRRLDSEGSFQFILSPWRGAASNASHGTSLSRVFFSTRSDRAKTSLSRRPLFVTVRAVFLFKPLFINYLIVIQPHVDVKCMLRRYLHLSATDPPPLPVARAARRLPAHPLPSAFLPSIASLAPQLFAEKRYPPLDQKHRFL
jgi:hypothetical protein